MRGDLVIVKAYGEIPLIRRVWSEGVRVIYITNDEQLKLLENGKDALEPIGFPREDVFKYNQEMAESMENRIKNGEWDWTELEHL